MTPHPAGPTLHVEDTYLQTPGGKLFVRTWGNLNDAAPIILFHDSLGCVELWRDFPSALAAATGRAVIAYDRLGFGKSDPHRGSLAVDFIRDEGRISLPALRAALGITNMILFGHSVGGGMAVTCGAAFPDATRAVVTVAAQAFIEVRTLSGIRTAAAVFHEPGQFEKLARYHGDKAKWVLTAWTGTWLSPAFGKWNLDADLPLLRCPVLAMHGDRDEYGSATHPQRIAAKAEKGEFVIFDDCGHFPHREKPAAVLETVKNFLDKL